MYKKLITSLTIIILSLNFISCYEATELNMKPTFETKKVSVDNCSFEIPTNWHEFDISDSSSNTVCFAPSNADLSFGTSNITLSINKTEIETTLSKIKSDKNNIKNNIKKTFPTATNFKYDEFSVHTGDVFIVNYDVSTNGTEMNNTQYYLLASDKNVIINLSNYNDDVSPNPEEISKYILYTLRFK